ncbi:MAG: hypothetical protein HQK98_03525 [Nitrospirae bacterium]|nr:hypothetical protein [Nitrospirota bacterium]
MEKSQSQRIAINDINLSAFLTLKGITPDLTLTSGRVIFEFPITDELYNEVKAYNTNELVPCLDFISALRRLRGQMLSMRGQK